MPTEQEIFNAAHAHVAKWESGYFDHPNDPGGVTNFGVSLMFLKGLGLLEGDIDGDGNIDRDDVLAVTKDTSKDLFKCHFWDRPGCASMPPLVAVAYYDLAVNAGAGRSTRILQQALGVKADGIIGPLTREALRVCNQYSLALSMLDYRARWYRRLAAQKPTSKVFLKGWLNRTDDCRNLIATLSTQWGVR